MILTILLFFEWIQQLAERRRSFTRWWAPPWRIPCHAPARREPSNRALATTASADLPVRIGSGADVRTTSSSASNSAASSWTPARKGATSVTWWTCTTTKPVEWWVSSPKNKKVDSTCDEDGCSWVADLSGTLGSKTRLCGRVDLFKRKNIQMKRRGLLLWNPPRLLKCVGVSVEARAKERAGPCESVNSYTTPLS